VWKHEDKTVVRFGDHRILDELTVKKIGDELLCVAAGAKCHHLIVNFTGVEGLSTLMLGKLLMLRKIMATKGGRLILCEIAPDIESVFVETKLTQILETRDTEAEALEACNLP
jgi:anti-anti-sigma factor